MESRLQKLSVQLKKKTFIAKQFVCLIAFSYGFAGYSQTFLKVDLFDIEEPVSVEAKKKLDSINGKISAFKIKPDTNSFKAIENDLQNPLLNQFADITEIRNSIERLRKLMNVITLDSAASVIQAISFKVNKKSQEKALDSINNNISTFKQNKDSTSLMKLESAIKLSSLKDSDIVKSLSATIENTSLTIKTDISKKTAVDSSVTKLDTVSAAPKSPATDGICAKLKNSKIIFIKGDNDSYVGLIEDSAAIILESFTIVQLNKELFYSKLKQSFQRVCDSTSAANAFLKQQKSDPELYLKFLEAKENIANTNGLAGTLKIYRNTLIHFNSPGNSKNETFTDTSYSDIKSLKKAKTMAAKEFATARKLSDQLDSLVAHAATEAKSDADKTALQKITDLAKNVKGNVKEAREYLDSISNKIPDDKILDYYNKAIRLSKKAQNAANKARSTIRGAYNSNANPTRPTTFRTQDVNDAPMFVTVQSENYTSPVRSLQNESLLEINHPDYEEHANDNIIRNDQLEEKHTLSAAQPANITAETDTAGLANLADSVSNFIIHEIQIQFQDGFIENIKVFGKRTNGDPHMYRFENAFPISFSTKKDFRDMIDIMLYEKSDHKINSLMYLKLGEVISYNQNLAVSNKDYSPANQVLTVRDLKSTETIREVALYKDQTSRILEMQVFSDLKGADNSNPNGLIQFELNKKLNLFSRRRQITNTINFGLFNFVTPQFSINKIEENQKRLILNTIDTLSLAADKSKPISYTSTINLLSHQIYKVGFDVSIFLADIPYFKSNFDFGAGVHFGRSAIQDTLKSRKDTNLYKSGFIFSPLQTNNVLQYGVNTFQWGPYLRWQIFPDSRFGVMATQRFTWFKALTNNFVQVRDSAHYLKFTKRAVQDGTLLSAYKYYNYNGSSNPWVRNIANGQSLFTKCIASAEIFAYFSPNGDGSNKLFFRYRLNWDLANSRENFHQMQIGFSTYINATKEYRKLKLASGVQND